MVESRAQICYNDSVQALFHECVRKIKSKADMDWRNIESIAGEWFYQCSYHMQERGKDEINRENIRHT